MKLVRASCSCGFNSNKARMGYNFHCWWFTRLNVKTGELSDVSRSLPDSIIDDIQFGRIKQDNVHSEYLEKFQNELSNDYADSANIIFDPEIGRPHLCVACKNGTLIINTVNVTAICNDDCGNEYTWTDSEQFGCPKCDYRPHLFRCDMQGVFKNQPRVTSYCKCCSSMDTSSNIDAFCPKCGGLPVSYKKSDEYYCGKHDALMTLYFVPDNYLFQLPNCPRDEFPNAKFYGDATTDDGGEESYYCELCENEYDVWKGSDDYNDG